MVQKTVLAALPSVWQGFLSHCRGTLLPCSVRHVQANDQHHPI